MRVAADRGVTVGLVVAKSYLEPGSDNQATFDEFTAHANIEVKADGNPDIFHQKLIVRDFGAPTAVVLTDSSDFTNTGVRRNYNHVVVPNFHGNRRVYVEILGRYRDEFEEAWAGTFGNRGQTDYAAANEALDGLAWSLGARIDGRAVSIGWGPWSPRGEHGGMVSPELAKAYGAKGIALLEPRRAVASLIDELRFGEPDAHRVLLTAASLEQLRVPEGRATEPEPPRTGEHAAESRDLER